MLTDLVTHISLSDVVDAYLRLQTKSFGQTDMARRIGTQRQGVNAIMNHRDGRRFTMEHLERFAASTGIMTSTMLAELANLAWEREAGLRRKTGPIASSPPALKVVEDEPASATTIEELAGLLRELIEERKQRR